MFGGSAAEQQMVDGAGVAQVDDMKKAYHLTPKSSARLAARKAGEAEQQKLEEVGDWNC